MTKEYRVGDLSYRARPEDPRLHDLVHTNPETGEVTKFPSGEVLEVGTGDYFEKNDDKGNPFEVKFSFPTTRKSR